MMMKRKEKNSAIQQEMMPKPQILSFQKYSGKREGCGKNLWGGNEIRSSSL